MKRIVSTIVLALVLVVGVGFAYLYLRKPKSRPAPDITIALTPERIARGKYVFQVAACGECHTDHEPTLFRRIDAKLAGGFLFPDKDLPGTLTAPNITPDKQTGIGNWTDGEILRAIREGVDKDGNVLFPMMPYGNFRYMSDDDAQAVVAYLRSLPPIATNLPPTKIDFPVNLMIKGAPKPLDHVVATPSDKDPVKYGEYLVTLGSCQTCHTEVGARGALKLEKSFAGGRVFQVFDKELRSANITPHSQTGIGNWSADYFRERFAKYKNSEPDKFTLMPWHNLAQLTDGDLNAIYAYLRTVPAIENKVNTEAVKMAEAR